MHNIEVKELALKLLTMESDRDRQKKVGASQISDPCTYHLATALKNEEEQRSKYWLGAKIGTAVHMLLEDAIEKADTSVIPQLEGAVVEQKIVLGELQDYGIVSSKPDLAMPAENHLIDWKTSTRKKSAKLQKYLDGINPNDSESEYTMMRYMAQGQLYAWGMNKAGSNIENISLVFINRDGTMESDVWPHTFEYDEGLASALWSRLESLWAALQLGAQFEDFDRHPECFRCKIGI